MVDGFLRMMVVALTGAMVGGAIPPAAAALNSVDVGAEAADLSSNANAAAGPEVLLLADGNPQRDYTLIFVNATAGNDQLGDGSQRHPLATITHALQVAPPNTVIVLAPGEYSEATGEKFPLTLRPGVTVQGSPGPRESYAVIRGSGIYASPSSGLEPVTILASDRSGLGNVAVINPEGQGKGVWIESGSPILRNNAFIRSGYAGVYIAGAGAPLIENNYFSENGVAGLVVGGASQAQVEENVFENTGVGIQVAPNATPVIQNNQIVRNQDGIILQADARPQMANNVIAQNRRNGIVEFLPEARNVVLSTTAPAVAPPTTSINVVEFGTAPAAPPAADAGSRTGVIDFGEAMPSRETPPATARPTQATTPTPAIATAPPATTPAVRGTNPTTPSVSEAMAEPLPPTRNAAPAIAAAPPAASISDESMPEIEVSSGAEVAIANPTAAVAVPEPVVTAPAASSSEPGVMTTTPPTGTAEVENATAEDRSSRFTPAVEVSEPDISEPEVSPSEVSPSEDSGSERLEAEAPAAAASQAEVSQAEVAESEIAEPEISASAASAAFAPEASAPEVTASVTSASEELAADQADQIAGQIEVAPEPEQLALVPESTPAMAPSATAAVPEGQESVPIRVIPPSPETVARPNPSAAAPATEVATSLPSISTSQPLPSAPRDIPALPPVDPNASPLAVPTITIPVGRGSSLPTVLVSDRNGDGPPVPPSRSSILGLHYKIFVTAADAGAQDQVRSLVPDAFRVRFQGETLMQAGAYTTEAEATEKAQRLLDQGLDARVEYVP